MPTIIATLEELLAFCVYKPDIYTLILTTYEL